MMGEPAWICVVGGSRSHVPFVDACQDRGLNTVVFDLDPDAPARQVATEFVAHSTHDTAGVLRHLEAAPYQPIGCFTYSSYEGALSTTAAVVERYGLAGLSRSALERMWSKPQMLQALSDAGLPTTEWMVTTEPSDLERFVADHGRAVVKPSRGGVGSEGVRVIDDATDDTRAAIGRAMGVSTDGTALVEGFVDGPEYSIDGYVQNSEPVVLAITTKHGLDDGPIMGGFSSGVGAEAQRALGAIVSSSLEASGLDNSYFSLDAIVSGGHAYVIDVGPLLDAKVDRMLAHAGVDVYGIAPDLARGLAGQLPLDHEVALRFLYADDRGELLSADEGAVNIAGGSAWIEFEKSVGQTVSPPESVSDVIGWITASGADGSALWQELIAVDLGERLRVGSST